MDQPTTESQQPQSDKFMVPGAIVLAGVIVAMAVLYSSGAFSVPKSPAKPDGAEIGAGVGVAKNIEDDDPSLGSPDAPVVLVEFSDFQCPFCRTLWREVLPEIKEKYIKTGKVRFVYRDFPLTGIHPMAEPSAMGAECADEQGKFWEMHDKIFGEEDKLGRGTVQYSVEDLKQWAREIGLDGARFDLCLDGATYKAEVKKDLADGVAFGVNGTPHVFVNGKLLIRGALPWAEVDQIIQDELAGK